MEIYRYKLPFVTKDDIESKNFLFRDKFLLDYLDEFYYAINLDKSYSVYKHNSYAMPITYGLTKLYKIPISVVARYKLSAIEFLDNYETIFAKYKVPILELEIPKMYVKMHDLVFTPNTLNSITLITGLPSMVDEIRARVGSRTINIIKG